MRPRSTAFVIAGAAIALSLGALVSPWASPDPDGLERVASEQGFAERGGEHALRNSPVAGYALDGVDDDRVAAGLGGLIGVLATFAAATAVFAVLRARRPKSR